MVITEVECEKLAYVFVKTVAGKSWCFCDFVRSGAIALDYEVIRATGNNGLFWSRVGIQSINSYSVHVWDSGVVASSGPNDRYNGYSLRCLQE